ncbi:hypothetical protein SAMN04487866_10499 [Thermoactinomyces sp. DSM 45891]|uniref:hypothetical protein n=1 Tax=Thermoactinomyces sp. DSM 45891 TaxID=1761907 RepID=UPI000913659A|nr:hypothetical protein [Thermoactinomyces sp. DSM 45891]SFX31602.1 hypothetical protein SAMN04487866_10499 [Thermoactinomyces sp. DSM 45891]
MDTFPKYIYAEIVAPRDPADQIDGDSSKEGNRNRTFMSWDLWSKIVDECSQYEDVTLTPSWEGEPMLHPQFQEFMAYAIARLGERIRLTTDGALINEQNKETLRNLTSITVNVNSDQGFERAVGLNNERDQHTYLTLAFASGHESTIKYFNYIVGDPFQDLRGFDFVVYHYELKEGSSYYDPYVGKTILIDPEGSVAFYLHPYHDHLETKTVADIWCQHDLNDAPDQIYHDCETRNRYGSQLYTPCNDYSKSTRCPKCDGVLSLNAVFCLDCEKQDEIDKLTSYIQDIPNSQILSGYKVFRIHSTAFEAYQVEDLEEDDEGPYSDCNWNGTAHEIADYIQGVLISDLDSEEYSCSRCEAQIKRNEKLCMGCYEREGLEEITSAITKITNTGIVSDSTVKRISSTEFEIYNDQNVCKCSGNIQKVAEYVYFFYPH